MTNSDPTAMRSNAERILAPLDINNPSAVEQRKFDANDVARAYLALTDPTPLSVGFLKDGVWFNRGSVRVGWTNREVQLWAWYELLPEDERMRIHPSPRTAGELRQLLNRMEPPHAR
jgi:hypothetical protein